MDMAIGRAINTLKERDLYENTLIVFVSDHGENFAEPDPKIAFGHSLLHKHVVNLPLIIKMPHSQFAGVDSDALLTNLDIAPHNSRCIGSGARSELGRQKLASHAP